MRNKPPYSITSVDHALQLASLLRQEGAVRVTDAAERLGVSVSTAHRLLAMLVYRDFAEPGPDRRYRPGPAIRPTPATEAPVALLRRVALPHVRRLVEETRESANLTVLAGTEARFIASVQCDQVLRVGDREGRSLPAALASGGQAILAGLPAAQVAELDGADLPSRLPRDLAAVRRRGFAINDQLTETGLTALGVAIKDQAGSPVAAISTALPTARFDRKLLPTWVGALIAAATRIENAVAAERP